MVKYFKNRVDAGTQLVKKLKHYKDTSDTQVSDDEVVALLREK